MLRGIPHWIHSTDETLTVRQTLHHMGLPILFLTNLRSHFSYLHGGTFQVRAEIPRQSSITKTDVFPLLFPGLLQVQVREVTLPTGRTAGLCTNFMLKEVNRKLQMKRGLSPHSQWAQSNSPWRPEHRYGWLADLVWSGLWPPCEMIHKGLSVFKASNFSTVC